MKKRSSFTTVFITALCIIFSTVFLLTSCGGQEKNGLSVESPTSVTIWHYYNGSLAGAFDDLVAEFNNTVGRENGIVVHSESMSTVAGLESALWDAANKKVGAAEMPNIFQCYQDTALALDERIPLVDFDDYIPEDEKVSYVKLFLDSGYIGENNRWKIFPIAKSTEVLILNRTDWNRFAADTGASVEDLSTWEGLAGTAEKYYEWSDGRAFFGRDSFANYLITASSQLGHELFQTTGGKVTLDFDKETMRQIWDSFYVPYVKGYYKHVGNYRCDDVKLGEIIALVCSSSSAAFFPTEVTIDDSAPYPITYMVLPLPNFNRTAPYAIQQGAGMAVTKSTEAEIRASITFLKWFTQMEQNLRFSVSSGYMPVSVEAIKPENVDRYLLEHPTSAIVGDTLSVSLDENSRYVMYTSPAFVGGTQARDVLERTMPELAADDRAAVEAGMPVEDFLTDEHFEEWYNDTLSKLKECCR
ncbi:MAG: extracellular solute-binding protein [Lachnospiraceae bacterium]|nr:extracellular solute-binding protein [Lachnospiraceae bacterium]